MQGLACISFLLYSNSRLLSQSKQSEKVGCKMQLSLQQLVESYLTDRVKINFDMPGGAWDRLYKLAIKWNVIPDDESGRRRLIDAILLVGGALGQNLPENSIVNRFVKEMLDEARGELGKRVATNTGETTREQVVDVAPQQQIIHFAQETKPKRKKKGFLDECASAILGKRRKRGRK